MDAGTGLVDRIAQRRAGVGDPAELVAAVRDAVLLVPLEGGGLWTARAGGVRWICAFTDEAALARFALHHGPGDASWEFAALLGRRLLDEIGPAMDEPAGLAVDIATEGGAMFFPPVEGIVPDEAAVDAARGGARQGGVGREGDDRGQW
ncbi:SseB family protein [Streptomyces sp. TS71-3]|uniref:SseB family protein n=1 Tax=Streptomyces sp. TS71-3 TaxID=2733862 RepID=UPI001BB3DFCE|nr:SseB family protein [Streptomyces sp. TS71-3]